MGACAELEETPEVSTSGRQQAQQHREAVWAFRLQNLEERNCMDDRACVCYCRIFTVEKVPVRRKEDSRANLIKALG